VLKTNAAIEHLRVGNHQRDGAILTNSFCWINRLHCTVCD